MNELTYTEEPPAGPQNAKRKKLFIGLGATVAILGGGYLAYDVLIASRHVETDNACVGANVAQVTPLISGPVHDVLVDDALPVKRGDILVRLDDTDARLTLARAEAELATTERRIRGLVATDSGLGARSRRAPQTDTGRRPACCRQGRSVASKDRS
ncbi:biotin/lipoyl-binding protein [Sphingopyxis sp.]|uniref:biotin/lipoyl-binding protein n=1 Tax=Sphingopyxis sp. TaxID=1908224 RepID=UPI0025F3A0D6|nr:biotin/lipoyl-binding protein [Sphingopyxis sp.]